MAEIPKLVDPKKGKSSTETSSERDLLIGFTSEVPLIVKELNTNPLQISGLFNGTKYNPVPPDSPLYANRGGWNAFQNFLLAKGVVGEAKYNAEEKKAIAKQWVKEFNSGEFVINGKVFDHVKKFPQNIITIQQIEFAQKYHKKIDPNIQVDGWVGSQTSQLKYPTALAIYEYDKKEGERFGLSDINNNIPSIKKDAYIPIFFGSKLFILKVEDQLDFVYKQNKTGQGNNFNKMIYYEKDKFPDIKFAFSSGQPPPSWYTYDQITQPNQSASIVNSKTEQQNKIKENFKSQTKITSNILAKK